MTRFTRAKGSKASNERVPNEGTPWHIMKQQLKEALSKEEVPQEKTKSARQLLKEKDDVYYPQSLGNTNADWAEFENSKSKTNIVKSGKVEKKFKDQQKKLKTAANKSFTEHNGSIESTSTNNVADKVEKNTETVNKEQDNKDDIKSGINTEDSFAKNKNTKEKKLEKQDVNTNSHQFKDRKRKNKSIAASEPASEDNNSNEQQVNNSEPEAANTKLSKRQKRNKKKQDQINEHKNVNSNTATSTFNVEGNDWNNSVETGRKNKSENTQDRKCNRNDRPNNKGDKWSQFEFKNFRRFGDNVPKKFQRKVAKERDDRDHQRRKPDNNVMKVTINGMDVEIVKYDGYPVKKEDAERLKELRQKMIMKGIPKSEINAAMKLERRKCEKVLARIRRQVCFHCRKAGHNLSDCPELGKEEAGTGICFKCGSTEHTHFECKVTKSDDYRYAKCFICREQGHISKQCPDNPKGLYPDGGCCKICGDVTHLKKDCPDLTKEKEETTITLDTIKDSNLESLDSSITTKPLEKAQVKKIVKF